MALDQRQTLFRRIEEQRGRSLITFFNFDRAAVPELPGIKTQFQGDSKEALFRVLKELPDSSNGIDICLYTRGGDTNAVWPLVGILREFDPEFEVLVPYRAHSSGTLMAMGARRVILGPISELSPIDPTTGNRFNPEDPGNANQRLGISVEDVTAYAAFVRHYFGITEDAMDDTDRKILEAFLSDLSERVHPLALGNVFRVHQQIGRLGGELLQLHERDGRNEQRIKDTVAALTSRFFSHLHMIGRNESLEILGDDHVQFADEPLAAAMDELLRAYEDDFHMREPFYVAHFMQEDRQKEVRFVGGAIESANWSYLHDTEGMLYQFSDVPANVQVQLPAGQPFPLIRGLPSRFHLDLKFQGWQQNTEPRGVTV